MEKRITEKLKRKSRFDQAMDDVMMIEKKPKRKKNYMEKLKLPEEEEKEEVVIGKIFLKLPEDVIEKIFLKVPANSLANLRYVSNNNYLWSLISNPSFVKLHLLHNSTTAAAAKISKLLISSSHKNHNYACNFFTTSSSSPEMLHCPFEATKIRASCNGLLYLHRRVVDYYDYERRRSVDILNYIWNPCTKEYKELPKPPPLVLPLLDAKNYVTKLCVRSCFFSSSSGFCGFGYDRINDEYKILHYENLVHPTVIRRRGSFDIDVVHVLSTVEFKLYTLGKNTWTSIIDNPYKSFFFNEPFRRIGLLVHGALHWIMCLSNTNSKGKIVAFDFGTEVFREVQKPHYYFREEEEEEDQKYHESLQVLQECLCVCMYKVRPVFKIDIWMLRDYDVPGSWTKSFTVMPSVDGFCPMHFTLVRYFEDSGEILMLTNAKVMIMYDPLNHKSRRATKFNESIAKLWPYYMDYTESLVSLNSGTYTSS